MTTRVLAAPAGIFKKKKTGIMYSGWGLAQELFLPHPSINILLPYPLATVKDGTWDEACEKETFPAFFILFSQVKTTLPRLPLRVIGYGTGSDGYSDKNALNELFDAYIFIRKTTAADHNL